MSTQEDPTKRVEQMGPATVDSDVAKIQAYEEMRKAQKTTGVERQENLVDPFRKQAAGRVFSTLEQLPLDMIPVTTLQGRDPNKISVASAMHMYMWWGRAISDQLEVAEKAGDISMALDLQRKEFMLRNLKSDVWAFGGYGDGADELLVDFKNRLKQESVRS